MNKFDFPSNKELLNGIGVRPLEFNDTFSFYDAYELWRAVAYDTNCFSIASAIRPTSECVQQFVEYAHLLLKKDTSLIPDFIMDDVRKVGAPRVYGVLRYLGRYAGDNGVSQEVERAQYRSWLNSNSVCIARMLECIDEICAIITPSVWEKALTWCSDPSDEVASTIQEMDKADVQMLTHLCMRGIFSNTECTVIPYTDKVRECIDDSTVLGRLTNYIINEIPEPEPEQRQYAVIPCDAAVARKYGLLRAQHTEVPNFHTLAPIPLTTFLASARHSVAIATDVPFVECVVVSEVVRDIITGNKHFRFANALLVFWSWILVTLLRMHDADEEAFVDHVHVHNLHQLYTASKKLHCDPYTDPKAIFYDALNAMNASDWGSNPHIDTHGKYEKDKPTVFHRWQFLLEERYDSPHPITFKAKYRKCRIMTVPKQLGKCRTITPCSVWMQNATYYMSIALKYALQTCNPDSYSFYDQSVQVERLAHGYYTVDASSASDLIDCFQVVACMAALDSLQTCATANREDIWYMVLRLRPYCCYLPDSCVFVGMYGCMGHNLTYVAQTLVFRSSVKVYTDARAMYIGDDGTIEPIPGSAQAVEKAYRVFGWKLNKEKSFFSLNGNGECVGAFRWTDDDKVPEIYYYLPYPRGKGTTATKENIVGALAHQHALELNGFPSAALYLGSRLCELGITSTTSHTPYEVWSTKAVPLYTDGAIFKTSIEIIRDRSAIKEEYVDEMKHYLTGNAPALVPDAKHIGFNGLNRRLIVQTFGESRNMFENLWVTDDPILDDQNNLREADASDLGHGIDPAMLFSAPSWRLVQKPAEIVYAEEYLCGEFRD